jgi:hypothetical protein
MLVGNELERVSGLAEPNLGKFSKGLAGYCIRHRRFALAAKFC